MDVCDRFNKSHFPNHLFNPMPKDEFNKYKCCPPWPGPAGPPGPPGPKGDPGMANMHMVSEPFYQALADEQKFDKQLLWVVYPEGLLEQQI